MLHESHAQKELIQEELERELETLKSSQTLQVKELEERVRETHQQDTKVSSASRWTPNVCYICISLTVLIETA